MNLRLIGNLIRKDHRQLWPWLLLWIVVCLVDHFLELQKMRDFLSEVETQSQIHLRHSESPFRMFAFVIANAWKTWAGFVLVLIILLPDSPARREVLLMGRPLGRWGLLLGKAVMVLLYGVLVPCAFDWIRMAHPIFEGVRETMIVSKIRWLGAGILFPMAIAALSSTVKRAALLTIVLLICRILGGLISSHIAPAFQQRYYYVHGREFQSLLIVVLGSSVFFTIIILQYLRDREALANKLFILGCALPFVVPFLTIANPFRGAPMAESEDARLAHTHISIGDWRGPYPHNYGSIAIGRWNFKSGKSKGQLLIENPPPSAWQVHVQNAQVTFADGKVVEDVRLPIEGTLFSVSPFYLESDPVHRVVGLVDDLPSKDLVEAYVHVINHFDMKALIGYQDQPGHYEGEAVFSFLKTEVLGRLPLDWEAETMEIGGPGHHAVISLERIEESGEVLVCVIRKFPMPRSQSQEVDWDFALFHPRERSVVPFKSDWGTRGVLRETKAKKLDANDRAHLYSSTFWRECEIVLFRRVKTGRAIKPFSHESQQASSRAKRTLGDRSEWANQLREARHQHNDRNQIDHELAKWVSVEDKELVIQQVHPEFMPLPKTLRHMGWQHDAYEIALSHTNDRAIHEFWAELFVTNQERRAYPALVSYLTNSLSQLREIEPGSLEERILKLPEFPVADAVDRVWRDKRLGLPGVQRLGLPAVQIALHSGRPYAIRAALLWLDDMREHKGEPPYEAVALLDEMAQSLGCPAEFGEAWKWMFNRVDGAHFDTTSGRWNFTTVSP
ncbi:MAG: hypothetical protein ACI8T1_001030 [Verrucomicrobiales bacterium]|jgi:hypothetical protein